MPEQSANTKTRRKPSAAIALSLIMPGLGHIYCGRIVKGIILAFLSSIFIPIIFGTLSVSHSAVRIAVIISSLFASLVVWLIATIDSWYTARQAKESYVFKDYNRWYVYIILILMSTGGSIQIAFHIRSTLVQAFIVPTASNYPAIVPGDRFLANKLAYKTTDPQRGDIVVFPNPQNRRQKQVKRVVGLAGDTVEIKNGQLYINDEKLPREKLPQSTLENIKVKIKGQPLEGDIFYETNGNAKYKIFMAKSPLDKTPPDFARITIPKSHCFVLGDNRNMTYDSRNYGSVPLATIIGRADYLYFPAKDFSRFGRFASK